MFVVRGEVNGAVTNTGKVTVVDNSCDGGDVGGGGVR